MKIGIVGSGIAGLTAAWLLNRQGHEVVVFERQPGIGLHDHACSYCWDDGQFLIDVPSRLLNSALWPELLQLFEWTGVETTTVDSSQVFATAESAVYFKYDLSNRQAWLPQILLNSSSRRIAADIRRLRKQGQRDLLAGLSSELKFGQYLESEGYSREFRFGFLFPLLSSTVCTCSFEAIENYPAVILLETLAKLSHDGGFLSRAKSGTQDISNRLVDDGVVVRTGTMIDSVVQHENHVQLTCRMSGDRRSPRAQFDHVIFAIQANHVLPLLAEPHRIEAEMLNCFQYEDVSVVVHTDATLMPSDERTWATFNFMLDDQPPNCRQAMCSIWLNRFYNQNGWPESLFQTINPLAPPARDRVLVDLLLQRPVVGPQSWKGWRLLEQMHRQSGRRTWFVGSYASYGVPLLETGVQSASKVAQAIGCELPTMGSGFTLCG